MRQLHYIQIYVYIYLSIYLSISLSRSLALALSRSKQNEQLTLFRPQIVRCKVVVFALMLGMLLMGTLPSRSIKLSFPRLTSTGATRAPSGPTMAGKYVLMGF